MKTRFLFIPLLLSSCVLSVWAQTPDSTSRTDAPDANDVLPNQLNNFGWTINGKAQVLPVPRYPAAARALKAVGTVQVKITVDKTGSVVSTQAVNGHQLLRPPAEKAARYAEFRPTIFLGVPVKVRGIITYVFDGPAVGEDILKTAKVKLTDFTTFQWLGLGLAFQTVLKAGSNPEIGKSSTDFLSSLSSKLIEKDPGSFSFLKPLVDVHPEERTRIVETLIAELRNNLKEKEKQQFELGIALGNVAAEYLSHNISGNSNELSLGSALVAVRKLADALRKDLPKQLSRLIKEMYEFEPGKKSLDQSRVTIEVGYIALRIGDAIFSSVD